MDGQTNAYLKMYMALLKGVIDVNICLLQDQLISSYAALMPVDN